MIRKFVMIFCVFVSSSVYVFGDTGASLMNFENANVTIEGEHELLGGEVNNAPLSFVLQAITKDAPMPADAKDGEKVIDIKPGEKFVFGNIHYSTYGTYDYLIKRNIVPSENMKYDETTYTVHVSVMADGSVVMIIENNTTKTKVDRIKYTDTYIPGTTPEKPKDPPTSVEEEQPPKQDPPASSEIPKEPVKRSGYKTGDILPFVLGGVLIVLVTSIVVVLYRRRK